MIVSKALMVGMLCCECIDLHLQVALESMHCRLSFDDYPIACNNEHFFIKSSILLFYNLYVSIFIGI